MMSKHITSMSDVLGTEDTVSNLRPVYQTKQNLEIMAFGIVQ